MPKNYCERCGESNADNILNLINNDIRRKMHLRLCDDCYKLTKEIYKDKLINNQNKNV